jgi:hypothetical protein
VLKENATYTINFGDAIQDLTESNPLENFSFVFSTGAVIDSLAIAGQILDAYTAEPIEDAIVMVYDRLEDSIPLQEKPFYATKTDKEGTFQIKNMKAGIYQVVAIKDDNLNYLVDPTEQMAFLDSTFSINAAGVAPFYLLMSQPLGQLYLDRRDTSGWNKAIISYTQVPYDLEVSYQDPDETLYYDRIESTLNIWYYSETRREWPVYLRNGETIDTLILKYNAPSKKMVNAKKLTRLKNSAFPTDPYFLCFDRPISAIDTSYIVLIEGRTAKDTVQPLISVLDSLPLCLQFEYNWRPDSTYQLTILPGGIIDLYQLENDTIIETFPIGNVERYGNIILQIEGLSEDQSYLVSLGIKDKPELTFMLDSITSYQQTIAHLKPATYDLRIIEDRNRNGRWDPGNLLLKIQPEPTRKYEVEQLRANWDVDLSIKWGNQ